jgi:hypothetical protein
MGCGEKEDTAEPIIEASPEPTGEPAGEDTGLIGDCWDLDVEQCGYRSDCTEIQGREVMVDDANQCYTLSDEKMSVGCMPIDVGCTEAIEFAQDPAVGECTWFSNGCLPIEWETCTIELEECQ